MFNLKSISFYILFGYFIFINENPIISKSLLALLIIVGLFLLKRDFCNKKIERSELGVFLIFILYFLSYIPSFYVEPNFSWRIVDHPSRFILFLPVAFIIKDVSRNNFFHIFVIATYIQSIIVIINFIFNGAERGFLYNSCISGAQNLLILGNFLLYASLVECRKLYKCIYLGGYILSVIVSLFSMTRGVILCIPFIFIIIFLLSRKYSFYSITIKALLLILFTGLIVTISPALNSRLDITKRNLSNNFQEIKDGNFDYGSSLGQRIAFFKYGITSIKLNPIFGSGRKGYVDSMISVGYPINNRNIATHSHNQFLSDLAMRGFWGFITTLLFMFYLLSTFIKDSRFKINIYSAFGIIFISSYLLYFFTDSPFIGSMHSLRFFIPMYFVLYYASRLDHKKDLKLDKN